MQSGQPGSSVITQVAPRRNKINRPRSKRLAEAEPRSAGDNSENSLSNAALIASSKPASRMTRTSSSGIEKVQEGGVSDVEVNSIRFGEVSVTWPHSSTRLMPTESLKINRQGRDALFHLFTTCNDLSAEEVNFIHLVMLSGPEVAIELKAKPFLECLRPLQALLAATDEPDKRYTKQNAKTRPPSGSPTSRRRSSSA